MNLRNIQKHVPKMVFLKGDLSNIWNCSVVLAIIAVVPFLMGGTTAQGSHPDTVIVFLVDESRSLTGADQSYQERLYNSVYFMKEAVGQTCQKSACYWGVSRFSENPVTLVPPKDIKLWEENDLIALEARPVDFNDRSDFPKALATSCTILPNAQNKAIILLTDGNLRSEANPDIAPVVGSISRSRFIEQIDHAVKSCSSNKVRLYTLLIDFDPPNDELRVYQDEEKDRWKDWSNETGGFYLETKSPDNPEAVITLLQAVAKKTGLSQDIPVRYTSDDKLILSNVEQHLRRVDINVVGLQPYKLDVDIPDEPTTQDVSVTTRKNQTLVRAINPPVGLWTARVTGSDDKNPFIIRQVMVEPQTYSLQLTSPADQSEVTMQSDLIIEIKVLASEGSEGQILGKTKITGTLTDSFGASTTLDFAPDAQKGVYWSVAFSGTIPSIGSYVLIVPSQVVDGVLLEELRADFKIIDEPFIDDWGPNLEGISIEAGKTITLSVKIGNHQLLTGPPKLQVVFSNDVDGDTMRPSVIGIEHRAGEFEIPFTVPQPIGIQTNYKVWVRLIGDITKQGISFPDKDSPTTRLITVLPVSTPQPTHTATPQPPAGPSLPIDPQLLKGVALRITGVYALACLVVILAWLSAIRSEKPYRKFIMADQALGLPLIIMTWPYAKGFRNIRDSLSLTGLSEQTTGNADEDNGINDVIVYLEKKFGSHAPKSLQKMKDWDQAFGAIQGGLKPNSPHNSIYIAGASQAIKSIIEDCLVAHETGTSKKDTPTPADLYYDLLNKGFDPILPRHPQAM